ELVGEERFRSTARSRDVFSNQAACRCPRKHQQPCNSSTHRRKSFHDLAFSVRTNLSKEFSSQYSSPRNSPFLDFRRHSFTNPVKFSDQRSILFCCFICVIVSLAVEKRTFICLSELSETPL